LQTSKGVMRVPKPQPFKLGGLPSAMQCTANDIGLGHEMLILGNNWYALYEAWIVAEMALANLGGNLLELENRQVPVPASLVKWSKAHQARDYEAKLDFSDIEDGMARWWQEIMPSRVSRDANELILTDWCGAGLTGIILIMVGMKEWGMKLTEDAKEDWMKMVLDILDIFKLIPSANDL